MTYSTSTLLDSLKAKIHIHEWDCDTPKGVLVIAHGMMEHAGRYSTTAKALNKKNYIVIAADHRGHGKNIDNCSLGDFGEGATWDLLADTLAQLVLYAKDKHPTLNCTLLGHSMGSFIAERACQRHTLLPIKGLILMGTANEPSASTMLGSFLASMFCQIFGPLSKARFFHTVIFLPYTLSIKKRKTAIDWLSRDSKSNEAYRKDPLCGFICTNRFYKTMFAGINTTLQHTSLANLNKALPIAFFSGTADPLSRETAHPKQLASTYRKLGHTVSEYYYEGARHELLNETNKSEVVHDIVLWIDNL